MPLSPDVHHIQVRCEFEYKIKSRVYVNKREIRNKKQSLYVAAYPTEVMWSLQMTA